MSGGFLSSYLGTKRAPFLLLDFESGGLGNYFCKATNAQFAPTSPGSPSALSLATLDKKFGTYSLYSPVDNSSFRFINLADSYAWDFISNLRTYQLVFWIKVGTWPPSGNSRILFRIHASAMNSNAAITVSLSGGSGSGPRISFTFPLSINFLASTQLAIPQDSQWHMIVAGCRGGFAYVSVDGAPSPAGVARGIGASAPELCEIGIGNGELGGSNSQFQGYIDHIIGTRAWMYDLINGFTPPTAPPVL